MVTSSKKEPCPDMTIVGLPSTREWLFDFNNASSYCLVCGRMLRSLCMRLVYNHYSIAQAYNAANAHAQGSDRVRWSQKLLSRHRQLEYIIMHLNWTGFISHIPWDDCIYYMYWVCHRKCNHWMGAILWMYLFTILKEWLKCSRDTLILIEWHRSISVQALPFVAFVVKHAYPQINSKGGMFNKFVT